MNNQLPHLTVKQKEILKFLYKYRFLNRPQIQALLNHKDKRRVISWLKDLREKEYVAWQYDGTDFIAKSKPAIYYLSLNGIRYLRDSGSYPSEELRKRYKEPGRKQVFIDRCLLVADCCIALQAKNDDKLEYSCVLPADYADSDGAPYLLDELRPHLFFSKQQDNESTNYILESFEQTLPRYQLRKRLTDYLTYMTDQNSAPIALFVCANMADLLYVKRRMRKMLEEHESESGLLIRVAALDRLKVHGITSQIWEEV